MSTTEVVGWVMEISKAIFDAIAEAVKGPEPPSLDELKVKVHAAIDARTDDWLKQAKADADKALVEAAAAEFSAALKDEIKKP